MPAPQKIEALLFDMGGVVFNIDFERAFQTWLQWTPLPLKELRSRFKMDEAYQKHERGEINGFKYFNHLRSTLELTASDEEIASGWNNIFLGEIDETINYILKAKNHLPCFAFTNSNATHQKVWLKRYPKMVDLFDQIFVSSELGLRKPEREAFQAISNTTGNQLENMLFFDDSVENVEGAHAAGLQAVLVNNYLDVKQALMALDVL